MSRDSTREFTPHRDDASGHDPQYRPPVQLQEGSRHPAGSAGPRGWCSLRLPATGPAGSCKGKLIEGRIDYGRYSEKALTPQEREHGHALFLPGEALSDVVIEAREVRKAGDIQVRKLPARVHKLSAPRTTP